MHKYFLLNVIILLAMAGMSVYNDLLDKKNEDPSSSSALTNRGPERGKEDGNTLLQAVRENMDPEHYYNNVEKTRIKGMVKETIVGLTEAQSEALTLVFMVKGAEYSPHQGSIDYLNRNPKQAAQLVRKMFDKLSTLEGWGKYYASKAVTILSSLDSPAAARQLAAISKMDLFNFREKDWSKTDSYKEEIDMKRLSRDSLFQMNISDKISVKREVEKALMDLGLREKDRDFRSELLLRMLEETDVPMSYYNRIFRSGEMQYVSLGTFDAYLRRHKSLLGRYPHEMAQEFVNIYQSRYIKARQNSAEAPSNEHRSVQTYLFNLQKRIAAPKL
ncbi:MAG: hypothetical protein CL677_09325 [Bdellovibrionaceae bacterium]|nr:hypothetical protein [Pseudobdellovibrionaceae bacterium]